MITEAWECWVPNPESGVVGRLVEWEDEPIAADAGGCVGGFEVWVCLARGVAVGAVGRVLFLREE